MRKKINLIFKLCAGAALGVTAFSYMVEEQAKKDLQYYAVVISLETGMMNDFIKCANEKVEEQTAEWETKPVVDVARKFGKKNGFPTLEGGSLAVHTSLPDYLKNNVGTMSTNIDRETGAMAKSRYNYVSSLHEAQHEVILKTVSSCLNARGPMA